MWYEHCLRGSDLSSAPTSYKEIVEQSTEEGKEISEAMSGVKRSGDASLVPGGAPG